MASQAEWRGQRHTKLRLVGVALAVSVLMHLPLTPAVAPLGLLPFLKLTPSTALEEDLDEWVGIPVTLEEEPPPSPEPGAAAGEAHEDPEEPETDDDDDDDDERERWVVRKRARGTNTPDAGDLADAGVAADAASDAWGGVVDAGADSTPAVASSTPAEPEPAPEPKKPEVPAPAIAAERSKTIRDPVALSGKAGSVTDANANVRLLVFTDRIRKHKVGPLIGDLLVTADQWRAFFKVSGLDPVRDIDRILIAGPQLRDSSGAVIVLQHHSTEKRIHGAIDRLVKSSKPPGEWLDQRVAKANVDRADRILVQPGRGLVVVGPAGIEAQAKALGGKLRFPEPDGQEVLSVFLRTPHRAFKNIPFAMPESLRWVRMQLLPGPKDGVIAVLEAQDESAESAAKHARQFETALDAVTRIKLPGALAKLLGRSEQRLVESIQFSAKGDRVMGRVVATGSQLAPLLEAIAEYAKELQEKAKARAKERKEKLEKEAADKAAADKAAADKAAAEAQAGKQKKPSAGASSGRPPTAPSSAPSASPQPSSKQPSVKQPPPAPERPPNDQP